MAGQIELYQDIATEGDYEGKVNMAHPWWIRFPAGGKRPATQGEIALWEMLVQARKERDDALDAQGSQG